MAATLLQGLAETVFRVADRLARGAIVGLLALHHPEWVFAAGRAGERRRRQPRLDHCVPKRRPTQGSSAGAIDVEML